MKKRDKDNSVFTDDVEEIMGTVPNWITRWGISYIFIVISIMLIVSNFIRYPETIKSDLKITSINPPQSIKVKKSGKLVKYFVSQGQYVNKNKLLAVVESVANYDEVLYLESKLNQIHLLVVKQNYNQIDSISIDSIINIGEIQVEFSRFISNLNIIKSFSTAGFYDKKLILLYEDLKFIQSTKINLISQRNTMFSDYKIMENEFLISTKLNKQGVITDIELSRLESKLLNKKSPLQQLDNEIIMINSSMNNKNKEILELKNYIIETKNNFLQSINILNNSILDWKSKYLLYSQTDGVIIFPTIIYDKMDLVEGQELFYIKPSTTKYFGEMYISQNKLGKIKVRQKVTMKFESYPFQEFGIVIGEIAYISDVPKEDFYLIKIDLKNGLTTTYGKKLEYKNGLVANSEIIIDDISILDRIFYNFKSLIN